MATDGLVGRLIKQGFRRGLDRDSNLLVGASTALWVLRFARRVSKPREEVLYSSKLAPGRVLSISGELFEFGKAPDATDDRALLDVPGRSLNRRERRRAKSARKAAKPPRWVLRKEAKQARKEAEQARRTAAKQARKSQRSAAKAADKAQRRAKRVAGRTARRAHRQTKKVGGKAARRVR